MADFYSRRTSGLPPSAFEYAMPIMQYGRQIKADRKAEEDYGLRKKQQEEDRNIAKELRALEQQRYGEDKAYRLSRDAKQDMLAQEQADLNAGDKLEASYQREWERGVKTADQKRQADKDAFDMKIAEGTLKIQQKLAEVKGLNPEATSVLTQVESLYKSLPGVYEMGDAKVIKSITDKITELNAQYKQLTSAAPAVDTNMGLRGYGQVRGLISAQDKAKGTPQNITLPPTIKTTSQALQYLKQTGMNDAQAAQWIRENN